MSSFLVVVLWVLLPALAALVTAAELSVVLDGRGFQPDPSVLDRREKPCIVDRRCHRIGSAGSSTDVYVLYDSTRVQTVLVSHGNHTGTEVVLTTAAGAASGGRAAVELTGRELAYERNP